MLSWSSGPRLLLCALAAASLQATAFCASLTLTSQGIADGFTLSTFATTNPGNTGCCGGPFGVAVTPTGNIIVNTGVGEQYVFADADGQTPGTALFTNASAFTNMAYATAGGQAYGGQAGQYVQFKPDGTVDHVLTGVTPGTYLGMWSDAVNGHLIAISGSGLIDIDPLANGGTGSYRQIAYVGGDGVTVSPDGKTAYVANAGQIVGYDIATGNKTFTSGGFSALGGPDGPGVIASSNSLNGDIVINFNGDGMNTGGIGLLDPTTLLFTTIATGGTRGDYVSPDITNGTLFLDYSDGVERLSCGVDCGIGSAPPVTSPVPEPGSVVLLATGLSFCCATLRRRLR